MWTKYLDCSGYYWAGGTVYSLGHFDPKGEETMENGKTFGVATKHDFCWKTQQEAEEQAKRATAKHGSEYFVIQAVSQTKVPTPEIELVKI